MLASVTRQDLARQVAYLKEENRILRARLPERLVATDQEKRRLLRFGKKLGQQLKENRPGESGPGTGLRKWGVVVNGCGVFDCPSATVASSFFGGTIPRVCPVWLAGSGFGEGRDVPVKIPLVAVLEGRQCGGGFGVFGIPPATAAFEAAGAGFAP